MGVIHPEQNTNYTNFTNNNQPIRLIIIRVICEIFLRSALKDLRFVFALIHADLADLNFYGLSGL